jgi:hypothetical protein
MALRSAIESPTVPEEPVTRSTTSPPAVVVVDPVVVVVDLVAVVVDRGVVVVVGPAVALVDPAAVVKEVPLLLVVALDETAELSLGEMGAVVGGREAVAVRSDALVSLDAVAAVDA